MERPAGCERLLQHGKRLPTAIAVEDIARHQGIGVYSLGSGAAHLIGDVPCAERGLIIGYTALPERMIAKGIARLAKALTASEPKTTLAAASAHTEQHAAS